MLVRLILAIAFMGLLAAGLGYLLSAERSGTFAWFDTPGAEIQKTSSEAAFQGSKPPEGDQPVDQTPPPPSEDALGFMLASAASQYAESTRYPSYSVPLSSSQASAYAGNRFEPVSIPLGEGGQFTVTLEKYRFVVGEPILIAAQVTGPQVVSDRMSAALQRPDQSSSTRVTRLAREQGMYQGSIEAPEQTGEYRLLVEAKIDGKDLRHVSTLTVEPFLGEFGGVGTARINNNDLVIPVTFDAEESGFYHLSAQLTHQGQPLAQLQTEQQLVGGESVIELKAHGSVIANRSISGKLKISHLQIRRLPAQPGDRTDYGFGPEAGYSFTPPDLTSLTDTPASDPESEQRAALLQKLADKF